MEQFLLLSEI
uniref:Uncharacterized protein n=1 Tax=Rhizophora mucronata TaxID=61149 RepID=A0A2P2LC74_RHIMU